MPGGQDVPMTVLSYRASDLSDHLEGPQRLWTDGVLVADSG